MSPTPATHHLLPIFSAPRAACLYLMLLPHLFYPLLPPLAYNQVPFVPSGLSRHGYICVFVPLPVPPCVCSASRHLLFLGICFGVSILCEGEGPGRLHSLAVAHPGPLPPSIWTCGCRKDTCIPPLPPSAPLPPPLVVLILYIIKIISCNMTIDDVDSHTPYFDVFI